MAGLVPAIHVFSSGTAKTWMPGTSLGMTRSASVSLLHLARVHLDRSIKQFGRERGFHREWLFHAEIGLHQFVVLFHPLGIDPAQRLGRGEIVGHQEFDAFPLPLLIFLVEAR